MPGKYRLLGAVLLLPIILSACDWGTSRIKPPNPDDLGPRIGLAPPADRLARHRLANGVRVLVLPAGDQDQPNSQFVHGTLRLSVGSNSDPEGMPGLAEYTALAVWAGLPASDSSLHYSVDVAPQWTDFSFRAPRQSLNTALSYLHFGLAEAEFDAERILQAQQRLAESAARPPDLLQQALTAFVQRKLGVADASSIPVAAVRRFHAEHYGSRNAIFAVSPQRGSTWLDAVADTLGQWQPQPAREPQAPTAQPATWKSKALFHADAMPIAWLAFAPAPRWDHPDMAALLVAQRLLQNEKWQLEWRAGYATAGWFVAAPRTNGEPALSEWQALIDYLTAADQRIADISDAEFESAGSQATSALYPSDGSSAARLNQALLLEFHDYPRNFLELVDWSISKLSRADVRSAVRRHLRPQSLRFYAQCAGDTDLQAFRSLGDVGWVQRAPVLGVAPDSGIVPSQQRVEANRDLTESSSPQPEQVDSNWASQILDAHGGADAWQAADLLTVDLLRMGHHGKPPSRAELVLAWPESLRYQTRVSRNNAVFVNGDSGWWIGGNGDRPLSAGECEDWHNLRMVLLASVLMEMARGTAVIHDQAEATQGLQVMLNSGRTLELRLNDAGRVGELRASGWRVEYLSHKQFADLWLPRKLHFYVSPSSSTPNRANRAASQWEQWELQNWQINPPRQAHWFEPPAGS